MLYSKELSSEIQLRENGATDGNIVVIRIDGKDYAATVVRKSYDGVLGHHIIIEAESLSKHV